MNKLVNDALSQLRPADITQIVELSEQMLHSSIERMIITNFPSPIVTKMTKVLAKNKLPERFCKLVLADRELLSSLLGPDPDSKPDQEILTVPVSHLRPPHIKVSVVKSLLILEGLLGQAGRDDLFVSILGRKQ